MKEMHVPSAEPPICHQ